MKKIFNLIFKVTVLITFIAMPAFAARGGKSGGGEKSYNCKRDKVVDDTGSIDISILSGSQVGILLNEGSDAAGMSPYAYTYKVERLSDSLISNLSAWVRRCYDTYFINDGIIGNLEPAQTYSISLVSKDACGNSSETVPQTITMPELTPEVNAPIISWAPHIRFLYFLGAAFSPKITVGVLDDTEIDRVEFYVNGELRGVDKDHEMHLFKSNQGEWYQSQTIHDLNGTIFAVEVVVYDVFGNKTSVTKEMTLNY